jgi:membrane protein
MLKQLAFLKEITVEGFKLFRKNQPLLLASSTAFFTTFSLPPITILLVYILSFYFFKAEHIRQNLFDKLKTTFGDSTAEQISTIAENFRSMASNTFYTIAGTVFLLFVATTLFYVVQMAIHQIWSIRITKRKVKHQLIQRGIALLMIISAGLLMLFTLLSETVLSFIGSYLEQMLPGFDHMLVSVLGALVSLLIYTIWFAILFRYLPDARIPFRIAIKGGLFTAVLFYVGKRLLGLLLVTDRMGNLFGASASIVVLMLFIFYASMIVYFGVSVTYVLLTNSQKGLRTNKYSKHVPS